MTHYEKLLKFKKTLINRKTIKEQRMCQIFQSLMIGYKEQKIICPYIVDFYIPSRKLIIEIDGSIHNTNRQKEKDYKKDDYLMSLGLMLQRFRNDDSEEYIVNKLLEYKKYGIKSSKTALSKIDKVNYFFHKSKIKINKANDIKELLTEYSIKLLEIKGKEDSFIFNKAYVNNCFGIRDIFIK